MNLPNDYEVEGQLSIFDVFSQDLWSGRMYQEHLAQTKEKTLEPYLKKFAEFRIKPPQFLCLKKTNGVQADASWEMGGQLLGEYTMHSFGECPNEERESLLSQILEVNPQQKYCLSAKACQGILRRAENRGKELPPQLKEALTKQSVSKNEPDVMGGGKGILIQHERTGALSTLNNQSVLCGFDAHNILETGNQCQTLTSGRNDTHSIPTICEVTPEIAATLDASYYKGCGERQGVERTVVCIGNGQTAQLNCSNIARSLDCMHDQQAILYNHPMMMENREPILIESNQNHATIQSNGISTALPASMGMGGGYIPMIMKKYMNAIVRRLTPLECERLQGFPDGWTDIGEWIDSKGKKHKDADTPRYKALGNSIALPFWEWMADRMVKQLKADGVESPTMASLFDGIGGFPLVYSRCGCEPVWASEIEEFPIAVTKIRFPEEVKDGHS